MTLYRSLGAAVLLAFSATSLSSCGSHSPGSADSAAIEGGVTSPAVRAFYEARGWKPAWTGRQGKHLLEVIGKAQEHGLNPMLFLKGSLPREGGERDAALSEAAFAYAHALARGYVDPAKEFDIYTIPRPSGDGLDARLAVAVDNGDVRAFFDSLPPQSDEYHALSQAHLKWVDVARSGKADPVPDGPPIKPGTSDRRVPAIHAALIHAGYLAPQPEETSVPTRLTQNIVAGVKRLQADSGIETDGVVGGDTLDVLNAGAAGRARQTAIGMERLRWLQREAPPTRIDVNIASAIMRTYVDGRKVDERRVVVGEPDKQTPQLQSDLTRLVANPYWRIPNSIIKGELAGKSAGYFAANQMTQKDGRLVQLPGPKNALGTVKFDLRNKHSIYLHDTPAKAIFATDDRHRSHGCVRVSDAQGFARFLANREGLTSQYDKAMASGEEKGISLKQNIPVRLMYHTAFLDKQAVRLIPDVYGWDDVVARGLGLAKAGRSRAKPKQNGDIGP